MGFENYKFTAWKKLFIVVGVGVLCPIGIRVCDGCHHVVNVCFCLGVSDYEFKLARRLSTDLDQTPTSAL